MLSATDNNTRIVFGSLQASFGDGKSLRGLFSYPLTDIPTGATINSVEFHVVQLEFDFPGSENGPVPVELRTISQSFSEGTGTGGTGGSSWNNTFGASMTLGSTVLSSAMMDPDPGFPTPAAPVETIFTTSVDLVAAVQTQLNAGQPFNFSLVLSPSYETSSLRRIIRTTSNSDTSASLANRPKLIIDYTAPAAGLPGDYNGNNQVDAADYSLWRKSLGGAATFAPGSRNPLNSGAVTNDDYDFWRAHFGNGSGSGASLSGTVVPEPATLSLVMLAMVTPLVKRRRA